MLTLFTTPKPFRDHFGIIQRNAIRSWSRLRPSCQIILFGDAPGVEDLADELRARHVPHVERDEVGMPFLKPLFQAAQQLADTPLLAYANADMIFMDDFVEAVHRLASMAERFVLTGQRHNVEVDELLAFPDSWQDAFRRRVVHHGFDPTLGTDYFVFPRHLWTDIPDDLALGGAGWDQWPLFEARRQKAIVVDGTPAILAAHQWHETAQRPRPKKTSSGTPAGVYGGNPYVGGNETFTILDATHLLTPEDLTVRCRSCYPVCVCKPRSFEPLVRRRRH